jgi:hypothetical protein
MALWLLRSTVVVSLLCLSQLSSAEQEIYRKNLALGREVTASSSPQRAPLIVDGKAEANVSWHTSWDPPQDPARPSWVMIDLADAHSLARITIAFSIAAYDGIYDVWAPPQTILVEIGDDIRDMKAVAAVAGERIPEQGACPDRRWLNVDLPAGSKGRFVKLLFPDGGKLSLMPNVVGLAEVQIFGEASPAGVHSGIALEDAFGRVVVDPDAPELTEFFLREPDGRLSSRSLLADWPRGLTLLESKDDRIHDRRAAYTYVSDRGGRRYESRYGKPKRTAVEHGPDGRITGIRLDAIRLTTKEGLAGPVEEDWDIHAENGALSWAVTQRWLEPASIGISGTPALYLARFGGQGAFRDQRIALTDPQVTSTLWYDPALIIGGTHPDYETYSFPATTEYRTFTLAKRDTWATYQLFTNFHLQSDIRASVKGGFLYRRAGVRNDFNEIGATIEQSMAFERRAGDVYEISLTLAPSDKRTTGEQLSVQIPDRALVDRLRDLHGSVLNGGVISDQKRFSFGNGSEDVNYAGSSDFQARALSVSIPTKAPAEFTINANDAFKGHLEQILATVDERGLTRFGFNVENSGALLDDNLHVISAVRHYVVRSGDRAFAERVAPTLARMADFFIRGIDRDTGLFKSPAGTNWYYDGIAVSGFNTYYQAFLYQALTDLGDILDLTGQRGEADVRRDQARKLAAAINAKLWMPDAPGGPRYADWIDGNGKAALHFVDLAQFPLIAFGIAPRDRALAVLATADKRLEELKQRFGYSRDATLSLLWPLSAARPETCFGTYFYGGSLLASTYWEVLARARVGNVDGEWGALRLLENFARHFERTSFVGSNAIDIRGRVSPGGDEGYLADMVVVPAALVHGLMGVSLGWNEITVAPALPRAWHDAKAAVMWMGRIYEISISHGTTSVSRRP